MCSDTDTHKTAEDHSHLSNMYTVLSTPPFYCQAGGSKTVDYLTPISDKASNEQDTNPFDILSDNCDVTVNPKYMTSEKQRQSYHWFMNIGVYKRILGTGLCNDQPKCNLLDLPNSEFLPTEADCKTLEDNFVFHVAKTLVNHIGFMQKYSRSLPHYINHPYVKESKQKSQFLMADLLDESETTSNGMLNIIKHTQKQYVPHLLEGVGLHPKVVSKTVMGGDVLTCQNGCEAQQALRNGKSDYEQCGGLVHRPEGLHRLMNLTKVCITMVRHDDNLFLI